MNKTTFEHKYNIGDMVYILMGDEDGQSIEKVTVIDIHFKAGADLKNPLYTLATENFFIEGEDPERHRGDIYYDEESAFKALVSNIYRPFKSE